MPWDPDRHFASLCANNIFRRCPQGTKCPLYLRLSKPETVINLEHHGRTLRLCAEVGGFSPHPNAFHQHYSVVNRRVLKKIGYFGFVRAAVLANMVGHYDCAAFMVDLGPGTIKFPDLAVIASEDSPMVGDYILGWKNHRNFCGCRFDESS